MVFFSKINEGWKTFKDSIIFIFKKPVFLIPIFFSWIVVITIVLYNRYYFPELQNFWVIILYVYFILAIMSFSIIFANTVMLELIQQIETGKKTSLSKALRETLGLNLIKIIPIAFIWALVWLFIVILRALTSKARRERVQPSVRDAARTLSGMNTPFSLSEFGLSMMEKAIRMTVFMALPAVAWENQGPFSAFKKSFQILKKHPVQFLTSYSLTFAAGVIMALPLVPIYILDEMGVVLSSSIWVVIIIYVGIVWTLEVYLEQMSVGILYLWHMKWLRKGGQGELSSVKKPDLFDEIYELT